MPVDDLRYWSSAVCWGKDWVPEAVQLPEGFQSAPVRLQAVSGPTSSEHHRPRHRGYGTGQKG